MGGVAALLLAGGIAFYMIRRKRRQQSQNPISTASNRYSDAPKDYGHGRTMSDLSQRSATAVDLAYPGFDRFSPTQSSQSPLLPAATVHTHASSVHSLSYFGSAAGSIIYPATSIGQSTSPQPMSPSRPVNQEDIIVPYTVPQSAMQNARHQASDGKRADGGIVLMYEPPTLPPEPHGDWPITGSSRRPRFNPPEYTPYVQSAPNDSSSHMQAPSSPGTRPNHSKNGSADTQRSWDSSAGNTSGIMSGHGPSGSAAILDDVIQRMGLESDHGHSVSPTSGSNITGLSAAEGVQNRVMM